MAVLNIAKYLCGTIRYFTKFFLWPGNLQIRKEIIQKEKKKGKLLWTGPKSTVQAQPNRGSSPSYCSPAMRWTPVRRPWLGSTTGQPSAASPATYKIPSTPWRTLDRHSSPPSLAPFVFFVTRHCRRRAPLDPVATVLLSPRRHAVGLCPRLPRHLVPAIQAGSTYVEPGGTIFIPLSAPVAVVRH